MAAMEPNSYLDMETASNIESYMVIDKPNESLNDSQSEQMNFTPSSQEFNATGFSKSTEKCVKFAVSLLKFWCHSNGISTDVENMASAELNEVLGKFYNNVRTKTGDHYSFSSLTSFRYSLNRYFQSLSGEKRFDIIEDPAFYTSNEIFNTVVKSLKIRSDEKTETKKTFLTSDDLRQIYLQVFAEDSPKALQYKVWFEIAVYFTKGAKTKQRNLTKNSFIFGNDAFGKFVFLKKNPEKDSAFASFSNREGKKMYEQKNHPLCPVLSLAKYLSKLHPDTVDLFQRPKYKISKSANVWYYHQPVGKNYLGNVMSLICTQAGISKPVSNKCMRNLTPEVLDACVFSIPLNRLSSVSSSVNIPAVMELRKRSSSNRQAASTSSQIDRFATAMDSPSQDSEYEDNSKISYEKAKEEIRNLFQKLTPKVLSDVMLWLKNVDFSKNISGDLVCEDNSHYVTSQVQYNNAIFQRGFPQSSYHLPPTVPLTLNYALPRYPLTPLPLKTVGPYNNMPPPSATPRQHHPSPGQNYVFNYSSQGLCSGLATPVSSILPPSNLQHNQPQHIRMPHEISISNQAFNMSGDKNVSLPPPNMSIAPIPSSLSTLNPQSALHGRVISPAFNQTPYNYNNNSELTLNSFTKSTWSNPGNHHSNQINHGNIHSNQINPGNLHSNQINPGNHHSNQINPGNLHSNQINPGSLHSNQINVDGNNWARYQQNDLRYRKAKKSTKQKRRRSRKRQCTEFLEDVHKKPTFRELPVVFPWLETNGNPYQYMYYIQGREQSQGHVNMLVSNRNDQVDDSNTLVDNFNLVESCSPIFSASSFTKRKSQSPEPSTSVTDETLGTPVQKKAKHSNDQTTPEPNFRILSVVSMSENPVEPNTPTTDLSMYQTDEAKKYFNYLGLNLVPKRTEPPSIIAQNQNNSNSTEIPRSMSRIPGPQNVDLPKEDFLTIDKYQSDKDFTRYCTTDKDGDLVRVTIDKQSQLPVCEKCELKILKKIKKYGRNFCHKICHHLDQEIAHYEAINQISPTERQTIVHGAVNQSSLERPSASIAQNVSQTYSPEKLPTFTVQKPVPFEPTSFPVSYSPVSDPENETKETAQTAVQTTNLIQAEDFNTRISSPNDANKPCEHHADESVCIVRDLTENIPVANLPSSTTVPNEVSKEIRVVPTYMVDNRQKDLTTSAETNESEISKLPVKQIQNDGQPKILQKECNQQLEINLEENDIPEKTNRSKTLQTEAGMSELQGKNSTESINSDTTDTTIQETCIESYLQTDSPKGFWEDNSFIDEPEAQKSKTDDQVQETATSEAGTGFLHAAQKPKTSTLEPTVSQKPKFFEAEPDTLHLDSKTTIQPKVSEEPKSQNPNNSSKKDVHNRIKLSPEEIKRLQEDLYLSENSQEADTTTISKLTEKEDCSLINVPKEPNTIDVSIDKTVSAENQKVLHGKSTETSKTSVSSGIQLLQEDLFLSESEASQDLDCMVEHNIQGVQTEKSTSESIYSNVVSLSAETGTLSEKLSLDYEAIRGKDAAPNPSSTDVRSILIETHQDEMDTNQMEGRQSMKAECLLQGSEVRGVSKSNTDCSEIINDAGSLEHNSHLFEDDDEDQKGSDSIDAMSDVRKQGKIQVSLPLKHLNHALIQKLRKISHEHTVDGTSDSGNPKRESSDEETEEPKPALDDPEINGNKYDNDRNDLTDENTLCEPCKDTLLQTDQSVSPSLGTHEEPNTSVDKIRISEQSSKQSKTSFRYSSSKKHKVRKRSKKRKTISRNILSDGENELNDVDPGFLNKSVTSVLTPEEVQSPEKTSVNQVSEPKIREMSFSATRNMSSDKENIEISGDDNVQQSKSDLARKPHTEVESYKTSKSNQPRKSDGDVHNIVNNVTIQSVQPRNSDKDIENLLNYMTSTVANVPKDDTSMEKAAGEEEDDGESVGEKEFRKTYLKNTDTQCYFVNPVYKNMLSKTAFNIKDTPFVKKLKARFKQGLLSKAAVISEINRCYNEARRQKEDLQTTLLYKGTHVLTNTTVDGSKYASSHNDENYGGFDNENMHESCQKSNNMVSKVTVDEYQKEDGQKSQISSVNTRLTASICKTCMTTNQDVSEWGHFSEPIIRQPHSRPRLRTNFMGKRKLEKKLIIGVNKKQYKDLAAESSRSKTTATSDTLTSKGIISSSTSNMNSSVITGKNTYSSVIATKSTPSNAFSSKTTSSNTISGKPSSSNSNIANAPLIQPIKSEKLSPASSANGFQQSMVGTKDVKNPSSIGAAHLKTIEGQNQLQNVPIKKEVIKTEPISPQISQGVAENLSRILTKSQTKPNTNPSKKNVENTVSSGITGTSPIPTPARSKVSADDTRRLAGPVTHPSVTGSSGDGPPRTQQETSKTAKHWNSSDITEPTTMESGQLERLNEQLHKYSYDGPGITKSQITQKCSQRESQRSQFRSRNKTYDPTKQNNNFHREMAQRKNIQVSGPTQKSDSAKTGGEYQTLAASAVSQPHSLASLHSGCTTTSSGIQPMSIRAVEPNRHHLAPNVIRPECLYPRAAFAQQLSHTRQPLIQVHPFRPLRHGAFHRIRSTRPPVVPVSTVPYTPNNSTFPCTAVRYPAINAQLAKEPCLNPKSGAYAYKISTENKASVPHCNRPTTKIINGSSFIDTKVRHMTSATPLSTNQHAHLVHTKDAPSLPPARETESQFHGAHKSVSLPTSETCFSVQKSTNCVSTTQVPMKNSSKPQSSSAQAPPPRVSQTKYIPARPLPPVTGSPSKVHKYFENKLSGIFNTSVNVTKVTNVKGQPVTPTKLMQGQVPVYIRYERKDSGHKRASVIMGMKRSGGINNQPVMTEDQQPKPRPKFVPGGRTVTEWTQKLGKNNERIFTPKLSVSQETQPKLSRHADNNSQTHKKVSSHLQPVKNTAFGRSDSIDADNSCKSVKTNKPETITSSSLPVGGCSRSDYVPVLVTSHTAKGAETVIPTTSTLQNETSTEHMEDSAPTEHEKLNIRRTPAKKKNPKKTDEEKAEKERTRGEIHDAIIGVIYKEEQMKKKAALQKYVEQITKINKKSIFSGMQPEELANLLLKYAKAQESLKRRVTGLNKERTQTSTSAQIQNNSLERPLSLSSGNSSNLTACTREQYIHKTRQNVSSAGHISTNSAIDVPFNNSGTGSSSSPTAQSVPPTMKVIPQKKTTVSNQGNGHQMYPNPTPQLKTNHLSGNKTDSMACRISNGTVSTRDPVEPQRATETCSEIVGSNKEREGTSRQENDIEMKTTHSRSTAPTTKPTKVVWPCGFELRKTASDTNLVNVHVKPNRRRKQVLTPMTDYRYNDIVSGDTNDKGANSNKEYGLLPLDLSIKKQVSATGAREIPRNQVEFSSEQTKTNSSDIAEKENKPVLTIYPVYNKERSQISSQNQNTRIGLKPSGFVSNRDPRTVGRRAETKEEVLLKLHTKVCNILEEGHKTVNTETNLSRENQPVQKPATQTCQSAERNPSPRKSKACTNLLEADKENQREPRSRNYQKETYAPGSIKSDSTEEKHHEHVLKPCSVILKRESVSPVAKRSLTWETNTAQTSGDCVRIKSPSFNPFIENETDRNDELKDVEVDELSDNSQETLILGDSRSPDEVKHTGKKHNSKSFSITTKKNDKLLLKIKLGDCHKAKKKKKHQASTEFREKDASRDQANTMSDNIGTQKLNEGEEFWSI